jgi:hypothetical protein
MDTELLSEWAEQLRLCCDALSRSRPDPAMVVQIRGRLRGHPGQAVPILRLVKRLAAEYGLRHQASLVNRELSVRLRARDSRDGGACHHVSVNPASVGRRDWG